MWTWYEDVKDLRRAIAQSRTIEGPGLSIPVCVECNTLSRILDVYEKAEEARAHRKAMLLHILSLLPLDMAGRPEFVAERVAAVRHLVNSELAAG